MSENMYNSDHKATNPKFRKNYDEIRWDFPKKRPHGIKKGCLSTNCKVRKNLIGTDTFFQGNRNLPKA